MRTDWHWHWKLGAVAALAGVLAACNESTAPRHGPEGQRLGVLQLQRHASAGQTSSADPSGAGDVRWEPEPREGWDCDDCGDGTAEVVLPPEVLEIPDTVEAGRPFEAKVYTIGASGCWGPAGIEVRLAGSRTVDLTPFDVHSGHDACTMILAFLPHPASLTLHEPGEWVVRVTGRRLRQGDDEWERPVTAEKTIIVVQ